MLVIYVDIYMHTFIVCVCVWVGGGHVPEASAMSRRQRCEAGSEAMQEQRP